MWKLLDPPAAATPIEDCRCCTPSRLGPKEGLWAIDITWLLMLALLTGGCGAPCWPLLWLHKKCCTAGPSGKPADKLLLHVPWPSASSAAGVDKIEYA